jgi:hypothetical protein
MLEGFLGNWGTAIYGFEGLKGWWKHLKTLPYMGGFMAYELVSDLRWTPLLDKAPDIMTWANPGPGAQRGLSWLTHDDNTIKIDQDDVQPSMQELLARAGDSAYWPKEWRSWEMREVEHWLCEYDKWERSNHGQSQKRRYSY